MPEDADAIAEARHAFGMMIRESRMELTEATMEIVTEQDRSVASLHFIQKNPAKP